jgi:DNA-directed RNA polymerase specialized sigma24 family protein
MAEPFELVFPDVWRQAGRFEGRSAVSTWLVSIARFKALSARRRRTRAELNETISGAMRIPVAALALVALSAACQSKKWLRF